MRYEITVSRKVQTYPYENVGITYTQEFNDDSVPPEGGFMEVSEKVDEWVKLEESRLGPRSPEPKTREPYLDMSNEPRAPRRYR